MFNNAQWQSTLGKCESKRRHSIGCCSLAFCKQYRNKQRLPQQTPPSPSSTSGPIKNATKLRLRPSHSLNQLFDQGTYVDLQELREWGNKFRDPFRSTSPIKSRPVSRKLRLSTPPTTMPTTPVSSGAFTIVTTDSSLKTHTFGDDEHPKGKISYKNGQGCVTPLNEPIRFMLSDSTENVEQIGLDGDNSWQPAPPPTLYHESRTRTGTIAPPPSIAPSEPVSPSSNGSEIAINLHQQNSHRNSNSGLTTTAAPLQHSSSFTGGSTLVSEKEQVGSYGSQLHPASAHHRTVLSRSSGRLGREQMDQVGRLPSTLQALSPQLIESVSSCTMGTNWATNLLLLFILIIISLSLISHRHQCKLVI